MLVEGERITSRGMCWGAQLRSRVPLLFLGRRQYLMALTDRRILVFERNRRGPRASELVIGKRYETFTLEKVKRRRPLMQVQLRAVNGNVMVFEFRPGQRELGGELIARLTPSAGSPSEPSHLMSSLGSPAPAPERTFKATGPMRGGSAAASSAVATKSVPDTDDDDTVEMSVDEADDDGDHGSFWDRK